MKFKIFLFVLVCCFMSCQDAPQNATATTTEQTTPAVYERMENEQFLNKLMKTENAQLIDVRTLGEYEQGHIGDAVMIDYMDESFNEKIKSLDKTRPVFVYCQGGNRSQSACNLMKEQGFTTLYELKHGYSGLQE